MDAAQPLEIPNTSARERWMFAAALVHLVVLGGVLQWWNRDPHLDLQDRTLTLALMAAIWIPFWGEALWTAFRAPRYPGKLRRTLLVALLPAARLAVCPAVPGSWVWLPGVGWHRTGRRLCRTLERRLAAPMLAFTLLILPVLGVEFFMKAQIQQWPALRIALDVAVVAIWVAFAAELALMLAVSEDRLDYLKRHWVNVLIVLLPTLAFLRGLQVVRLVQLAKTSKLLRIYRLRSLALRGYESLLALSVIERILHRNPDKLRARLEKEIARRELELAELRARLEALPAARVEGDPREAPERPGAAS